MTRNQISYWELIEGKRANLAREYENYRHNLAQEEINMGSLRESQRHNLMSEEISQASLVESQRHNKEYENIERDRIITNYELGRYSSELSSAASRYGSELGYAASKYSSDVNREMRILEDSTKMYLGSLSANETERSNKARETQNRLDSYREYDYKQQYLDVTRRGQDKQYALGMEGIYVDTQNTKIKQMDANTRRGEALINAGTKILNSLTQSVGNLSMMPF